MADITCKKTLHPRPAGLWARPEQLWDAWAFAAVDAELALNAWRKAANEVKEAAYAAYRAALEREEHAATSLAARIAG
jgi:hypothetical protein